MTWQSPFIPAWMFQQGFTPTQLAVLCYVAMRGKCWENKRVMATALRVNPATLKKTLCELLAQGWLLKTMKQRSHCYQLAQGSPITAPQPNRLKLKNNQSSPSAPSEGSRPRSLNHQLIEVELEATPEATPTSTPEANHRPIDTTDKYYVALFGLENQLRHKGSREIDSDLQGKPAEPKHPWLEI
jgi:hypothetical protein